MTNRIFTLCLLSIFLTLSLSAQNPIPKSVEKHIKKASGDEVKKHIAYLADDKLKGRLPGTPEYKMAIEYVEEQLKKFKIQPAGENGTYRQAVSIRSTRNIKEKSSMTLLNGSSEETLEEGKDYVLLADPNTTESRLTAEVVFAGYGIAAPELGHDDYADVDAEGKVVLLLWGVPEGKFGSSENAHFGNFRSKYEMAHEQGARGVIILAPPVIGDNFARLAGRYGRGGRVAVAPDGKTSGYRSNPFRDIEFVSVMSWSGAAKLLGQENKNSRELAGMLYAPKEEVKISSKVQVVSVSEHEEFTTYNVAGVMEGSDPELKNEYVIHSAHLDHVGVGNAVEGDSIYNGAHDNASGSASLLEIARLYTSLKKDKPKRSILFLWVTAEEMGLLGSLYFGANPTVPKEQIVADINTDMPTLIAPLLSIEPLGAEHSSLMNEVKTAAEQLDLEVMPDHMPEQVRFVRSDQYSFILQGIPSLHIKYGLKTKDPNKDLTEQIEDYTENVYHKPSDELNELFDFDAARTYVQLNFLISYQVAQEEKRPKWNGDSFFRRFAE
jgi:hypothetical protein